MMMLRGMAKIVSQRGNADSDKLSRRAATIQLTSMIALRIALFMPLPPQLKETEARDSMSE